MRMPVLLVRILEGLGQMNATRYLPGVSIAAAASLLVVLGVRRLKPTRLEVDGDSMQPTLVPGDRLLSVRRRPARGDLVAVVDPRVPSRLLVKRAVEVLPGGGLVVRGDNPGSSTDSLDFGPVPTSALVGVVVYRYAPAARAGRLGGGPPARGWLGHG
jgi:nickel-type superoxide dismutase maturation protease